ncbi:PLP-dependent aminotransferase family protein [Thalassobaculum sp.]|uniref:aminotransferase-like domain-containing protein n=1 Tax=Thalassobaculum sp. TaxID=2022740 RepID=UPI0032EB755D
MWKPDLAARKGSRYAALADEIAEAIKTGRLTPGTRLPTQRVLARAVGLNLTTVNRGYSLAVKRGLISAEVGRGTFVRTQPVPSPVHWPKGAQFAGLDLSTNLPGTAAGPADLEQVFAGLRDDVAVGLLGYRTAEGCPEQRAAGAEWLDHLGVTVTRDHLLIVSGAMHGILISLLTICQPGDRVLVEELASPGVIGLCNALGLTIDVVPLDSDGVTPDGLERALEAGAAKALIVVPNLQNPTLAVMPAGRRAEIAAILKRRRLFAIENDVYGPLLPDADRLPPLVTLAPAWVCYVTSLSKAAAPGLRVGWLLPPASLHRRALDRLQVTSGMTSPILGHIAAQWIASGRARSMAARLREEARRRQAVASKVLDGLSGMGHPSALHVWLKLPEPWRSEEFAAYAEQHGVAVLSSDSFTPSHGTNRRAVRISLTNGSIDDLARGLTTLRSMLDGRL